MGQHGCHVNTFADASMLATRGLIPRSALEAYQGRVGYKTLADDLQIVVGALRNNWSQVEGKRAATLEELDRAERISLRLSRVVGCARKR